MVADPARGAGLAIATAVRIAFIGAGQMAGHHLQALRRIATPHVVVGVHDARRDAGLAFARRAAAPAYDALSELLEQAKPDLVHICTPAGAHFEAARQALSAGAHVYVEKPFVERREEAEQLFAVARERRLLIGAGHQLLRDPAFLALMRQGTALEPVTLVDSHFAFRPPRLDPYQAAAAALARQLLDVVPHPLYVLVAALERFGHGGAIEIEHMTATPTALYAMLRAGEVTGRLTVSLRARPVASTLTVAGANGSLTADFVRSIPVGAGNEGTSPLEKIANPFVEAAQLGWRSGTSLIRRVTRGAAYPGLVELLGDFYAAAAAGREAAKHSPIGVDHLRNVTALYERLATAVRRAVTPPVVAAADRSRPVAVVTGAAGFFGRAINRELTRRGFRVRGVGRSERPDDPHVSEWVQTDLANAIGPDTLAGSVVVVHAAAETAGGFEAHERNTIAATRELLRAMHAAGVQRLVHVSSLSVLRPPRPFWERQSERTPVAQHPEQLGPYTWGKCGAEALVAGAHARGEVHARIVRPAALIDWAHIELPGLVGRRLFGRWHLGLGRPGVAFAVCDVTTAAAAVAWCAASFEDAPPIVNLIDPTIRTRGELLERFRTSGWAGRVVWVPISVLAAGLSAARVLTAILRRERLPPLAAWSILRPRRYDTAVAHTVITAARDDQRVAQPARRTIAGPIVSGAYV